MEAVIKLYSLGYKQAKTYLAAALFTLGNMIVPQLCRPPALPYGSYGRSDLAAYLSFHIDRCL